MSIALVSCPMPLVGGRFFDGFNAPGFSEG